MQTGGGEGGAAAFVALHGREASAVIETPAGRAPLWRYWGPRLPEGAPPPAGLEAGRAPAPFSLSPERPLTVFPLFGLGEAGDSALLAHRDGRDFAQDFTKVDVYRAGPHDAAFTLVDEVAWLTVRLLLRLDPRSDVLTLSVRLRNDGDRPLEVGWLASGVVPLPPEADRVLFPEGRYGAEFLPGEAALGRAGWRRENRRGLTSHDVFPGAVATTPGATRVAGVVYAAQLAWSGNHAQAIAWRDEGVFSWQAGVWLAPGEARVGPGESLDAPDLLATVSPHGLDGAAQNFHAGVRARMSWPGGRMSPRPVHLNTWEAVYFDHDLPALRELAQAAARLGVERFVLDDGWFHRRDDDARALGDWRPDARKFPEGLAPLAEHVRALGMDFGLWVEPEMVSPDSDLHRAHPDWVLQLAGRPQVTGRRQLVLDVGRPEVADHLFDALSRLLSGASVGYLKWDHNRELATAGGADGRARHRAQTLGLYALLDRLRAAFPDVEIESCAAGGGRADAGVLGRTHRVWTSDNLDAVSRIAIQRGFLQFLPPEIMGAHVGASPAHLTGRAHPLAFRAAVAAPGAFGVELDPRKLDAGEARELAAWIALYKAWRERLHGGRVWLGESGDGLVWQAHGEACDLLVFLYRLEPTTRRHPPPLRLPMVERDRTYRLRREDPAASRRSGAPALDALHADGLEVAGAWLAQAGAPAPSLRAQEAAVLSVRAL